MMQLSQARHSLTAVVLRMMTTFFLSTIVAQAMSQADELPEILLWNDQVPGPAVAADPPEQTVTGPDGLTRRFNVSQPRLFVHLPKPDVPRSGAAVVVIPGGGFARLADEHEGSDACRWLTAQGIAAFQLAYRTPTSKQEKPNAGPVMDAQQAVAMIRSQAAAHGIDPGRIGTLGFSAGGQVALVAATTPDVTSTIAGVSSKPDFLLLIYPYAIYDAEQSAIRRDVQLDSGLPPTFVAQMADDTASVPAGSALLYYELMKRKVPAELHIYERGGHGFGMRPREHAPGTRDWALRAADWLTAHGLTNRSTQLSPTDKPR